MRAPVFAGQGLNLIKTGEVTGAMPLVVHFKRPAGWGSTVNIHFWDAVPAEPSSSWPGVRMRAETNDWFVHTFATAEAASIVFNDGAGRQTGNQRRDADGWFFTDQRWKSSGTMRKGASACR